MCVTLDIGYLDLPHHEQGHILSFVRQVLELIFELLKNNTAKVAALGYLVIELVDDAEVVAIMPFGSPIPGFAADGQGGAAVQLWGGLLELFEPRR